LAVYGQGHYGEALKWFRKAADQGEANAQNILGAMYYYGQGVAQNYALAVRWYRKAADQGHPTAQNALGWMYLYGQGVPQNYAEAVSWYRKVADRGEADPQNTLGWVYQYGQGVTNYAEAVRWYREAAEQGHAAAQFNLGGMYLYGHGVTQSYAEALRWYRKAADQGEAKALSALGVMYQDGQAVPQNYVQAYMWYNLAVSRFSTSDNENRDFAINLRNGLVAKMTSAQIAEAQKLAREWRPKLANAAPTQAFQRGVPLKMDGGIFVVPVQINGTITLEFVIDSGAADVSVPADVVSTLMRSGTIKETDFIGQRTYVLADGSKSQSATFTIRSLRVGDMVLENVGGSVASSQLDFGQF
jgi:TPR repeat protein